MHACMCVCSCYCFNTHVSHTHTHQHGQHSNQLVWKTSNNCQSMENILYFHTTAQRGETRGGGTGAEGNQSSGAGKNSFQRLLIEICFDTWVLFVHVLTTRKKKKLKLKKKKLKPKILKKKNVKLGNTKFKMKLSFHWRWNASR